MLYTLSYLLQNEKVYFKGEGIFLFIPLILWTLELFPFSNYAWKIGFLYYFILQIDHSVIQQIILKSYLAGELCSTMHTLLELFAADSDMFHKLLNISKHDNVPICLIES